MRVVSVLKGPTLCVRLSQKHAGIVSAHCAAMGVSGPELIRRLIDALAETKPAQDFPAPRRVGAHVIGWVEDEVVRWLEARIATR